MCKTQSLEIFPTNFVDISCERIRTPASKCRTLPIPGGDNSYCIFITLQLSRQLRVIIEDRRGELLMREIERRIKENSVESAFPDGDTTAVSTREGAVSSRGGAGA